MLDLYAARSGENLAWLRSPWRKEKRVLLLSSENAIVEPPSGVDVKAAGFRGLQGSRKPDV